VHRRRNAAAHLASTSTHCSRLPNGSADDRDLSSAAKKVPPYALSDTFQPYRVGSLS